MNSIRTYLAAFRFQSHRNLTCKNKGGCVGVYWALS